MDFMESIIREKLQKQLSEYILDTLKYTENVKEFCDRESKWTLQRETELDMMRDIKDRADQITLRFDHVQAAENKTKALGEYMRSGLTQITADSRKQDLEKELGEILKNTLEGLEKLQHFLDAVEKLAVTSLSVFIDESFMPAGVSSMSIRSVIFESISVSPLLVHFKRDAGSFFQPSLGNVEVLAFQLDKYIRVTQQICEKMKISLRMSSVYGGVHEWKRRKSSLKCNSNINNKSVNDLFDHLLQLTKIRMDESFRMTFLFGSKAEGFIDLFNESRRRMSQFLSDLEEAAVQLDKMKKGSNISAVAGSSVGVVGGVLSIVGLAPAPVTAGVSLALTLTGVGLGVTSGVNGIVTGITEIAVNHHHGKYANSIFTNFMNDVQKILDYMEEVSSSKDTNPGADEMNTDFGFETEENVSAAVNMGFQEAKAVRNISQLAADLPDVGQLAKGAPIAISKSARVGLIGLNALFIGLDVFLICKDSISLSKGSKNEVAQLIRSRSVLWRSEVEAWEKIYNHLCEGISRFHKNREILKQRFHC